MKYTSINLIHCSNPIFKNKLVLAKDSKLVDIIQSSTLQNKNYFHKKNNQLLTGSQKISNFILESYFHSIPTDNINKSYAGKNIKKNITIFNNSKILISNPIYNIGDNQVDITLFYYYNNEPEIQNFIKSHYLREEHLEVLSKQLSLVFNKHVHLNLIRVHYPFMNSQILAQYLCGKTDKNKFTQLCDALVAKTSIKVALFGKSCSDKENHILPAYIDSIRLELSGRVASERVVPRLTKQSYRMDSPNTNSGIYLQQANLSSDTIKNKVVDYGKYTSKNHLGSYTLKVWITSVVTIHKLKIILLGSI